MTIDRVILSCDDNPKFIEFWPLMAHAWKKIFGASVWLAVVATRDKFSLSDLRAHGNVVRYEPVPGIPTSNQAKMARYHLAAEWRDACITMTNDLDLLPLQKKYLNNLLAQRKPGHLMTIGSELYEGPEKGKFTAGYLTAESNVWNKLMNPFNLAWTPFIEGFIGRKLVDHKEDITRDVHHENPDTFSDESLLRGQLRMNPVPVIHLPRGFYPYTERALCRSDWRFDPAKLKDGTYVEAHLCRPFSEHKDRLQPLIDYIYV